MITRDLAKAFKDAGLPGVRTKDGGTYLVSRAFKGDSEAVTEALQKIGWDLVDLAETTSGGAMSILKKTEGNYHLQVEVTPDPKPGKNRIVVLSAQKVAAPPAPAPAPAEELPAAEVVPESDQEPPEETEEEVG